MLNIFGRQGIFRFRWRKPAIIIDDYNSYFGRTEINDIAGIIDNNVDVGYGFVGEAKEWIVGDVTMVGGAQQIDSVFSWDTMVKADIISNPHAITIGF